MQILIYWRNYLVGINIGDGNKIVNSNIAEKIENTNLKEKKEIL